MLYYIINAGAIQAETGKISAMSTTNALPPHFGRTARPDKIFWDIYPQKETNTRLFQVGFRINQRRLYHTISEMRYRTSTAQTQNALRIGEEVMDKFALTLAIIGALNLGSVGIFNFDVIAWAFGGAGSAVSRVIFTVVGLAGLWCVSLLFRDRERSRSED